MAKITNRLEEIKYWNKKRAEGVKKAQEKKKSQPIVYKQKKQIPIRKRSKKQSGRLVKYLRIRDKWFKDPTNQYCKLNMRPDCTKEDPRPSSDVHHEKGTIGELLFDTRFWRPGCRWCHRIAHDNDQEARDKGNIKSRHTIGKPMLAVVILKK